MTIDLKSVANLPVVALILYFASGLELYIFESGGIPPLYLQVVGLIALVGWIAVMTLATDGRYLTLPPAISAVYALLFFYMFLTAISFLYSVQNEIVVEALIARIKGALFLIVF